MHSAANVILFGMKPASTAREVEGVLQVYNPFGDIQLADIMPTRSIGHAGVLTCSKLILSTISCPLPELELDLLGTYSVLYRTLAYLMTGSGGTFIRAGRLKVNEFPDAFPDALRT